MPPTALRLLRPVAKPRPIQTFPSTFVIRPLPDSATSETDGAHTSTDGPRNRTSRFSLRQREMKNTTAETREHKTDIPFTAGSSKSFQDDRRQRTMPIRCAYKKQVSNKFKKTEAKGKSKGKYSARSHEANGEVLEGAKIFPLSQRTQRPITEATMMSW